MGITEDPSGGLYETSSEDKVIHTKEGEFEEQIKVSNIADLGYSNLFFYASSSDRIDTDRDPQKFFLITVVESINNTSEVVNTSTPTPVPLNDTINTNNTTEDISNTTEQQSQNEAVSETEVTPQPTATPKETTVEDQNNQNSSDTGSSAKKPPTLRRREDMTVPTLQRMVPGFELVFALIGILAAIYLRRR